MSSTHIRVDRKYKEQLENEANALGISLLEYTKFLGQRQKAPILIKVEKKRKPRIWFV